MAFVITTGCCNDASCVEVCPVDCIRPHPDDPAFRGAEQLYIDPDTCIGCSACMYACPVSAIYDELELPEGLQQFVGRNRDYFIDEPLSPRFLDVAATTAVTPVSARVAVIGTGPSGCYAIAELTEIPGIEVTVFDRLPTPFGLVRAGVAPDHPHTKLISEYFYEVLSRPNVTCYLNVEVGKHIALDDIRASHEAVIYAGGATDDRKLGIKGETLPGSFSAREFVAWYNGHPDFAERTFDLSGERAVLLGNGNVALDVARLLTRTVESLATTDIADHALDGLRRSNIREVVIAARRGPADAACTFPELLELTQLPGIDIRVINDYVEPAGVRSLSESQRQKVELFQRLTEVSPLEVPGSRTITFRFGVHPLELTGEEQVEALHLRPVGPVQAQTDVIETRLVLRAVGYQIAPVSGLPFNHTTGTLAHIDGRLVEEGSDRVIPGLYGAGWAKRGPSGVIGTNKVCSKETVSALVADLRAGRLQQPTTSSSTLDAAIRAGQPRALGLAGWRDIDSLERRNGALAVPARPRRKFVYVDTMLGAAGIPESRSPTPRFLDPVATT